ncbi:MAG TPA: hypothetical protein VGE77_06260 [Nocardioides sp.]
MTRNRLEQLRRRTRHGRYAEHETVEARHSSGALTLTVDCTGWVVDVAVVDDFRQAGTLPDLMVETYGVAELRRGLLAAAERGFDEDEIAHGRAIAERRVRVTVNRYPMPAPAPDYAAISAPRSGGTSSHREAYEQPRPLRGTSRDGELTVHAAFPMGFSRLEVDDEWVARATGTDVRYALREAFAAAYARGEW